jgi:hypothetical protein
LSLTGQCIDTTYSSSEESTGNVSEESTNESSYGSEKSTDESSCGSIDGEEIHSKIVYKHVGETRVATKTRRRKIGSEAEARVATERIKRRVTFFQDDVHDDTKKTK